MNMHTGVGWPVVALLVVGVIVGMVLGVEIGSQSPDPAACNAQVQEAVKPLQAQIAGLEGKVTDLRNQIEAERAQAWGETRRAVTLIATVAIAGAAVILAGCFGFGMIVRSVQAGRDPNEAPPPAQPPVSPLIPPRAEMARMRHAGENGSKNGKGPHTLLADSPAGR